MQKGGGGFGDRATAPRFYPNRHHGQLRSARLLLGDVSLSGPIRSAVNTGSYITMYSCTLLVLGEAMTPVW